MNTTIAYYDENALEYCRQTANADMSPLCDRFLQYIRSGGRIIDIGSGSGRDIRYFISHGYEATGIDASSELCRILSSQGISVENVTIQEWEPQGHYDGIWANASLLHIPLDEVERFLVKAKASLNDGGVIFASMKTGLTKEYDEKGRFFCPFDEHTLKSILQNHPSLRLIDLWHSQDALGREDVRWINFLVG